MGIPIVQAAHPGQYLQEVEIGGRLVSGAGRGFGAMPVVAERGKIGLPVIVRSPDEFTSYLGSSVTGFFGYDAMLGYFSKAKAPLVVVRVGHCSSVVDTVPTYSDAIAEKAFSVTVASVPTVLGKIKGANEGAWANGIRVIFTHETDNVPSTTAENPHAQVTTLDVVSSDGFQSGDHVAVSYNGTVVDYTTIARVESDSAVTLKNALSVLPTTQIVITRLTFQARVYFRGSFQDIANLSMSKDSARYVFAILSSDNYGLNSESANVVAEADASFLSTYTAKIATDCRPDSGQSILLTGGADSYSSLVTEDFIGAQKPIGASLFKTIDEAKILFSVDHWCIASVDNASVYRSLVDLARAKRFAFALGDLSENARKSGRTSGSAYYEAQTTINYKDMFGALYFPWIQVSSAQTGRARMIPCVADVAGKITEIDETRGVFKAPAGEEVIFSRITALKSAVTDEDQDDLNPIGVNCIRTFSGVGTIIWGARTQSNNIKWKYIPVRRYQSYIEESIMKSTRWAAFEPNDSTLRYDVTTSVKDFLTSLCNAGTLASRNPSEAFAIRCDDSNNTNNTIDEGRFILDVGVAHLKPSEFLIYRFTQTRKGAQIEQIQQIS